MPTVELHLIEGAEPAEILKTVIGRVKVNRFEVMEPSLYKIFIDMAKVDPKESQRDDGGEDV